MKRLLALLAVAFLSFSTQAQVNLSVTPAQGWATVTVDISPALVGGQRLQVYNGATSRRPAVST